MKSLVTLIDSYYTYKPTLTKPFAKSLITQYHCNIYISDLV